MWRSATILMCVFGLAGVASGKDLKVGDKAPPLTIGEWVKGEPVDLAKAGSEDVFVVEFWATWCGPCLMSIPHVSEMQDHFKSRDVTFIGISDEKPATVKKFLKNGWDAKMRYRVAMDDDKETSKAWMKASGQQGIPCAFIVKGGKIKWIGHPMDGLDGRVAELCGDKEYAKQAKELAALREEMSEAAKDKEWKTALAACDKMIQRRPKDENLRMSKYRMLALQVKDTEQAKKAGRDFVKVCENGEMLNEFAWTMLTEDVFEDVRDIKLATSAAKKAMDVTDNKNAPIIDTYARALWDSGDKQGAIKWQKKAVELGSDNAQMDAEIKKTLKDYEKRLKGGKNKKDDDDGDDDDDDKDDKDEPGDKDEKDDKDDEDDDD